MTELDSLFQRLKEYSRDVRPARDMRLPHRRTELRKRLGKSDMIRTRGIENKIDEESIT